MAFSAGSTACPVPFSRQKFQKSAHDMSVSPLSRHSAVMAASSEGGSSPTTFHATFASDICFQISAWGSVGGAISPCTKHASSYTAGDCSSTPRPTNEDGRIRVRRRTSARRPSKALPSIESKRCIGTVGSYAPRGGGSLAMAVSRESSAHGDVADARLPVRSVHSHYGLSLCAGARGCWCILRRYACPVSLQGCRQRSAGPHRSIGVHPP